MGRASRTRRERRAPTGARLTPIPELRRELETIAERGGAIAFFKFTCPACGAHLPIDLPNVLPATVRCAGCGQATASRTLRGGDIALIIGDPRDPAVVARAHATAIATARAGGITGSAPDPTGVAAAAGPVPAWSPEARSAGWTTASVVSDRVLWLRPDRDVEALVASRVGALVGDGTGDAWVLLIVAGHPLDVVRDAIADALLGARPPGIARQDILAMLAAGHPLRLVQAEPTIEAVVATAAEVTAAARVRPVLVMVDDLAAIGPDDRRAAAEAFEAALVPHDLDALLIDRSLAGPPARRAAAEPELTERAVSPFEQGLMTRYLAHLEAQRGIVRGPLDVHGERLIRAYALGSRMEPVVFLPSIGDEAAAERLVPAIVTESLAAEPVLWRAGAIVAALGRRGPVVLERPDSIAGRRSSWWTFEEALRVEMPDEELLVDALLVTAHARGLVTFGYAGGREGVTVLLTAGLTWGDTAGPGSHAYAAALLWDWQARNPAAVREVEEAVPDDLREAAPEPVLRCRVIDRVRRSD